MHFTLLDKISNKTPYNILDFIGGAKVIPMVYHTVGNAEELPYLKGLYSVPTPKEFESDLDFILKNYVPLDLEGLVKFKQANLLPGNKKYFFLSFDDGLRQCREIIAPILERKGVPATFFINTGFVGNNLFLHRFKVVLLSEAIKKDKTENLKIRLESFLNMKFTCRYKAARYIMTLRYPQLTILSEIISQLGLDIEKELVQFMPYMTIDEIRGLISKGFTVGAHSIEHPEFYLIDEETQVEQTCKSITQVKEWFNPKYNVFAFPFTDVGVKNSFFRKIEQQCKPDLTFGCSGLKKDKIPYNVHRIPMDDFGMRAEERLKSEFLHYSFKRILGKNTFRRK
jgi:peptidoglycan/xylan/chitin deacetylase (PgdA/CDA1 family)